MRRVEFLVFFLFLIDDQVNIKKKNQNNDKQKGAWHIYEEARLNLQTLEHFYLTFCLQR